MDLFEFAEQSVLAVAAPVEGAQERKIVAEATPPEVMSSAIETEPVLLEVVGTQYTAAWHRYRARVQELQIEASACNKVLSEAIGQPTGEVEINTLSCLEETRKAIFRDLISRACSEFAATGSTLEISSFNVREALGSDIVGQRGECRLYGGESYEVEQQRLNERFDPDAIWRWLADNYGGNAGERAAHAQVAKRLYSAFWMERRPPVMVSGKLKVEMHAYAEKKYSGNGWRYSYSTCETLRKALQDLGTFAYWAEDVVTGNALHNRSLSIREDVESREKYQYGPGLYCVTYNTKVDVFFSPALGEKFRLYMAEFCTPED